MVYAPVPLPWYWWIATAPFFCGYRFRPDRNHLGYHRSKDEIKGGVEGIPDLLLMYLVTRVYSADPSD